ncbi:MAG: T9SS type A sorting domain-containing protein [Candidatus Zixiibacteriota bacterium]
MNLVHYRRNIVLFVLLLSASAFSQTWNWASQVATFSTGGFGANRTKAIAVDANENIYAIGEYGDSALIGGVKVKAFGSGAELFLAKYNSAGTPAWVKSWGSTGFLDQAIDVTTDAAGDVYMCGSFFGQGLFDGDSIAPTTATVGLVKCNSDGVLQWSKIVRNETSGPGGITFANNRVYVAIGRTFAIYEPDGDSIMTITIPTSPSYFVQYRDVTVDVGGRICVVGQFKGTITFGTNTLSSSSVNDPDILVVKYEPDGNVIWAKRAGAVSTPGQEDIAQAVTTNELGDVYVVGQYVGKAFFDTDSVMTGAAIQGFFTVKYDSEGNFQWVKGSSGTTGCTANAYGVKMLANEDVLVSAGFSIRITVADTTYNLAGGSDVLMLRLSPDGVRRWGKRSDTFATACVNGDLALNASKNAAYTGGQFFSAITFGPTSMTIGSGVTDGWLAKMTINTFTDVKELAGTPLPQSFSLSQNYPNPFNPTTTIDFKIASASNVNISVINVLGQRVRNLVDQNLTVGNYSTTWDGRDEYNQPVSSGIYFYRLQSGSYIETHKMTLLK